jgi:hypothetical protein
MIVTLFVQNNITSEAASKPIFESESFRYDISKYYTDDLKETYPYLYVFNTLQTGSLGTATVSNSKYKQIYAFEFYDGQSNHITGSDVANNFAFFVITKEPMVVYTDASETNGGRITFYTSSSNASDFVMFQVDGTNPNDSYPYIWWWLWYTKIYSLPAFTQADTDGISPLTFSIAPEYCQVMTSTDIYDISSGKVAYERNLSDEIYEAGYADETNIKPIENPDETSYDVPQTGSLTETSSSNLYLSCPSSFTVTIPKSINLDSNKEAEYDISVTGSIRNNETVTVRPQSSVITMQEKDKLKSAATGTITQSMTQWSGSDISTGTSHTGMISVPDLSAGQWTGKLVFDILLQQSTD